MSNILIIYYYTQYPPRVVILDHLYSFHRYSGHHCFYFNLAVQDIPEYIKEVQFDMIVFHTIFLSTRWYLPLFKKMVEKVRMLRNSKTVKVALPQDEFFQTNVVCDFINEFNINYVFSCYSDSEWQKIYKTVDFNKVKFYQVLTGYLEPNTIKRIHKFKNEANNRTIDIGYRAWRAEPWLGRHGYLKTKIADLFQEKAPFEGLKTDISTHEKDTLLGDDWYKFLLQCKYTIGVEGGASLLDWDGTVREKTNAYFKMYPKANFEEVEEVCFPGLDGSLNYFPISPRHLEACATKTCQVLIEGAYNNILTPGRHYIELRRDLGNLQQVLDLIKSDIKRAEMISNAYRDVVESRRYTYQSFVSKILEVALPKGTKRIVSLKKALKERLAWHLTQMTDTFAWLKIRHTGKLMKILNSPFGLWLRRLKQLLSV